MTNRCTVVTMDVNITDQDKTADQIETLTKSGKGAYICVSNVHMCMETFDSHQFRSIVNDADLVIPDGRPIYWAQRLLGDKSARQVRGQDIMNRICKTSAKRGMTIGLYGGSSVELLCSVEQKLKANYPGISIRYSYSPPFRQLTDNEDATVIEAINKSGVDILFVGIGCPKQERWMAEHKDQLNCVMLGVGAAFDFIAGSKRHAPRWLQLLGLEWLFRLCHEPSRLWKRYLKQNPRFIFYFSRQWLLGKKYD